jgi:hypothetical protein
MFAAFRAPAGEETKRHARIPTNTNLLSIHTSFGSIATEVTEVTEESFIPSVSSVTSVANIKVKV